VKIPHWPATVIPDTRRTSQTLRYQGIFEDRVLVDNRNVRIFIVCVTPRA